MAASGRVLVLSAAIGEGHDLPARWLAAGLAEEDPAIDVEIADGLAAMGRLSERVVLGGSSFESVWGNRLFDVTHWLITAVAPIRALAGVVGVALGASGLRRLIAERRADVVVSTYPGVTEVLGRLRARRRLGVPVVSAITDLASLRYWAHPGVDLHLVTHPESIAEVRAVAGTSTDVVAVRGLNDPAFLVERSRADARGALDLPPEGPVVVISGGGWGVGDLSGAVDTVLAVDGAAEVADPPPAARDDDDRPVGREAERAPGVGAAALGEEGGVVEPADGDDVGALAGDRADLADRLGVRHEVQVDARVGPVAQRRQVGDR